jgi:Ca2+-binding RTX toxin-like protein
MPSVTVTGPHCLTFDLCFPSTSNLFFAKELAAAISSAVLGGLLESYDSKGGAPPKLAHGTLGEFVQDSKGQTTLPSGYNAVVDDAPNTTIFGSGGKDESVLSGSAGMTFDATGGSGSVIAGGGNNTIFIPTSDHGSWLIATGPGNDSISALGTGTDTIEPGGGANTVQTGGGNTLLILTGRDFVSVNSGSDTIDATQAKSTIVRAGNAAITFLGGDGPATLFGGSGSDTVQGGSGDLIVYGGHHGNNSLEAGTGFATLYGGGSGDQLFAQGNKAQQLWAGSGNETLSAAKASGYDTLTGGPGRDVMIGGSGNDTFFAGSGADTMVAGSKADTFVFVNGKAGGHDTITGFTSMDKIDLQGYGSNAITKALQTQHDVKGSVTITLGDNTTVTFTGVSSLNANEFKNLG